MTVLRPAKEILGVNNAQVQHQWAAGTLWAVPATGRHLTPTALRPAPARLDYSFLSISQYFSVFLSVPYLDSSVFLSISQYFSVFRT